MASLNDPDISVAEWIRLPLSLRVLGETDFFNIL